MKRNRTAIADRPEMRRLHLDRDPAGATLGHDAREHDNPLSGIDELLRLESPFAPSVAEHGNHLGDAPPASENGFSFRIVVRKAELEPVVELVPKRAINLLGRGGEQVYRVQALNQLDVRLQHVVLRHRARSIPRRHKPSLSVRSGRLPRGSRLSSKAGRDEFRSGGLLCATRSSGSPFWDLSGPPGAALLASGGHRLGWDRANIPHERQRVPLVPRFGELAVVVVAIDADAVHWVSRIASGL
jgi:hypothetical protein